MSARGSESKLVTRDEVERRDALIAELTQSQRRLQHLYEIGAILLRFETIEHSVPPVVAVIAKTLALRSAIFVKTMGAQQLLAFQASGEAPQHLQESKAHGLAAYSYFVPSAVALENEREVTWTLPELTLAEREARVSAGERYVLLPLIVRRGSIIGALQIESAQPLVERDLVFVSAVVNQLAIALERHAADEALRRSEAKLSGILSLAADAVISVDQSMCIVMYNEGAERIFGWTRAEVLAKPIDVLMPERLAELHRGHLREFQTAAETARHMGARAPQLIGRRKSGEEFPVDASISKLNVAGEWLFTVILRDITELKRVEREKAFLAEASAVLGSSLDSEQTLDNIARLVLRELADFCVIEFADEQGQLRTLRVAVADTKSAAAAAALERFPLDRTRPHLCSAVLEQNQPQLVPDVSSDVLHSMAQSEAHLCLIESVGLHSLMSVPLRVGGHLLGGLVVGSCRTDRRYGDTDLAVLLELGQRAALALESARLYRVAQRAIQVRDDVLGVVAHDLRNPLGSILMQAALFRRKDAGPERRARKPGEVIERAARRMSRLIQDLLDVTSMEAGRLSIDSGVVPVRELLIDLVESQQSLASSRSLELRIDLASDELELWGDRDRLLQVLENLVGNAIKFTPAGGRITVAARASEGAIECSVADTGAGISADDLPHLFERFWQVKKTARRGAGLGLAIVKGLVESHGGRIWVESAPAVGTTFRFTIPQVLRTEHTSHSALAAAGPIVA